MLHQLIIIHEEKMFINVLKKHCELKDVTVYDIESVNDFQYLIDDISPDIVLIDELIYQKYNDDILRQISQSSNSPKVGVLHWMNTASDNCRPNQTLLLKRLMMVTRPLAFPFRPIISSAI